MGIILIFMEQLSTLAYRKPSSWLVPSKVRHIAKFSIVHIFSVHSLTTAEENISLPWFYTMSKRENNA